MTLETFVSMNLGMSFSAIILSLIALSKTKCAPKVIAESPGTEQLAVPEPVIDPEVQKEMERIQVLEIQHRHLCSEIEGMKEERQNKLNRVSDEENPALLEEIAALQKVIDDSQNSLNQSKGNK